MPHYGLIEIVHRISQEVIGRGFTFRGFKRNSLGQSQATIRQLIVRSVLM